MRYVLTIPGRIDPRPAASFEEASRIYSALRDESGEGYRTWPEGYIADYGVNVARLSYNGRVWPMDEWKPGMKPLQEAAR